MKNNIWEFIHKHTSIGKVYGDYDTGNNFPEPQENYYNVKETIKLKCNNLDINGFSLKECLIQRKSTREFSDKEIDFNELSNILFWSYGKMENKHNVPSAGARFPVEIHVVINKINGIKQGIYHYDYKNNCLELTSNPDFRFENIFHSLTKQKFYCYDIPAMICLCADFSRTISKYGDRGYRYVYLDAGHIGQNLYLTATDNEVGIVGIGGFYDLSLKKFLNLPYNEYPIYIFAIGKKQ